MRFCGAPARGGDADLSQALPTDLGGRCRSRRIFISIVLSSKVLVKCIVFCDELARISVEMNAPRKCDWGV